VNVKGQSGITALIEAANCNMLDAVKALIAAGADVNAKDQDQFGNTPLKSARGNPEIFALLKAAGAKK
jgi:hypothetical protein